MAGGSDAAVQREVPELTREEVQRYSRHLIMPEVGMDGQRKLKAGSVVCVGAGGLGSPAAMYLAAAGIGTLGIIDFDTVDASNLHRQIIYGTADVGRRKLEASGERIASLNPGVKVVTHETALTSKNALDILRDYDVVLDGTDNFQTRYLVNDACVLLGKPNAYGSIFRFDGQASVFAVKGGPCYRCLYPEPPPPGLVPSCAEGGVLGVLPGVIGIIQATEAIKLIIGAGQPLIGRLLLYDALQMRFRELKLRRDTECPVCGDHPTIKALVDYDAFCGITPPQAQPVAAGVPEVTAEELKKQLDRGENVFVLDVREPNEYQICKIAGSKLIPLGELPQRVGRAGSRPRHGRPLQDGRPERQGRGAASGTRVHPRAQSEGRHPRVDRSRGSDRSRSTKRSFQPPGLPQRAQFGGTAEACATLKQLYFLRSGSRRSDGPS